MYLMKFLNIVSYKVIYTHYYYFNIKEKSIMQQIIQIVFLNYNYNKLILFLYLNIYLN